MHAISSLFARRATDARRPACAACGRAVGMFGPAWVERVDGTVEPAVWHDMSEDARHGVARAFHAGCFVPDHVPEWMRPSGNCVELPRTTVARHRSFRLSGTRWSTPTRVAAATLSLACAAIAALDAATVVLHSAPR